MAARLFSDRRRPVHLGPFPLERLARPFAPLRFERPDDPASIVNAMGEYQAMLDAIRDGLVNRARAEAPTDPQARADHLKAFGYFQDAAMMGTGPVPAAARLAVPLRNPAIDRLAQDLRTRQTKTLASGIDLIMADLKESMEAPPTTIDAHRHCIVILNE
nr:NAD-binding oxidoreductase [Paracoccaceae bacterium]